MLAIIWTACLYLWLCCGAVGNALADSFQLDPITARTFKDAVDLKIAVVGHGSVGTNETVFWPTLWRGIGAAQSLLGVTINAPLYQLPSPTGTGYNIQLWADAINNRSDGLVTTFNDAPSQQAPLLQDLSLAPNMPVISFNSGLNFSNIIKPVTFVGWAEWEAGFLVGQELVRRGATSPVCVFRILSRTDFQDRCRGAVAAFNIYYNRSDVWTNDTANPLNYFMGTADEYPLPFLVDRFQRFLASRPDIDAAIATQYIAAEATHGAVQNIASIYPSRAAIQIGVVDFNAEVIELVDVAVHQQTWLQGFLPSIYMYLKLMVNETVASPFVPTGPLLITNDTQALVISASALEAQTSVNSTELQIAYINHFNGLSVSDYMLQGVNDASAKWNLKLNPSWTSLATPYTYESFTGLVDGIFSGCPADCPAGFLTTDPGDAYLDYLSTKAAAHNVSVVIMGIRSAANTRAGSPFYVGTDDYEIGLSAGTAMLASGVTKPLCLSRDDLQTATSFFRCKGLVDAFINAGVPGVTLNDSQVWVDPYNKLSGELVIKPLLAAPAPDGFFCTNEAICDALVLALTDTGTVAKAVISGGISQDIAGAMARGIATHWINTAPYSVGFLAITSLGMTVKLNAQVLGNTLAVGGQLRDWACPPGYYVNTNTSAIMYQALASGVTGYGTYCIPCAAGTFSAQPNQMHCSTCPLGTFSTLIATETCATCTETNGADQDVCIAYQLSLEQEPSEEVKGAVIAIAAIGILAQCAIGTGLWLLRRFALIRGATPALSLLITLGGVMACLSAIIPQFGLSKGANYRQKLPDVYNLFQFQIARKYPEHAENDGLPGYRRGLLLAIWTGLDAPTKHKFSDTTGTYSLCSSDNSKIQTGFVSAVLVYNGLLLAATFWVVPLTKNIINKNFSESCYVGLSMAATAICAIGSITAGFMPGVGFQARWAIVNLAIVAGSIITPLVLFGSRINRALKEKVTEGHSHARETDYHKRPLFANGKGSSTHIGVEAAILEGYLLPHWDHPEKGEYYLISNVRDNGYKIDSEAESDFLVLVSGKGSKSRLVLQFPDASQTNAWKEIIARGSLAPGNALSSEHSGSSGSLRDPKSKRTAYASAEDMYGQV
ncbi:hypothetical protein HDU87_002872 [Geranomyces variabilis]|uniref:G-protein coupled receptors family 3 profile domain-containing protein n=1 Tax=Geranomyces variabilis TaxID=109894 RepID=A0AAD5TLL6_9FUNG|nr:hypothetical protein HDU87_002872 [Geranomyces variabilis]